VETRNEISSLSQPVAQMSLFRDRPKYIRSGNVGAARLLFPMLVRATLEKPFLGYRRSTSVSADSIFVRGAGKGDDVVSAFVPRVSRITDVKFSLFLCPACPGVDERGGGRNRISRACLNIPEPARRWSRRHSSQLLSVSSDHFRSHLIG